MKNWSIGRLDFSLPEKFKLIGRKQSIYHVLVETFPLQGKSAQRIWEQHLEQVRSQHVSNGFSQDTFNITEISPGFSAVFYNDNPTMPISVTVEAYKQVQNDIVKMEFTGKQGKEDVMLRVLSIIADGYRPAITNGFNVGAGSLISPPSVNERAAAGFEESETHMELDVELNTAGSRLSEGPLENIDDEMKGLGAERIKLKIIHRRSRKAAGFYGEEALVQIKDSEESRFRYTWFYAGETANSFKPDTRIQLSGSAKYQEEATAVWDLIINSMRMRKP